MLAKEQLRDLQAGRMGGDRPETKYLNKKRDLVRKLISEKNEAVERGVKAKVQSFEGEMIDEMLQAALGLDVEEEVEKRVDQARRVVEEGRVEDSAANSSLAAYKGHLSRSTGKKNVKFQSPNKYEKFSSSNVSHSH